LSTQLPTRRTAEPKSGPFTLEHFEWYASRLILDNCEPWELDEYQRLFAEDIFGGARENWEVVPEGNGKSTFVAGLGVYGLRYADDALIPVAASSRDQARIIYRQAKGFLKRSDLDESKIWFEAFDGYRRIDLRGPGKTKRGQVLGTIEIHAADAGTGDGVIPYPYAFVDELHRHPTLDLYHTWSGKLDKRGAQIITISTAGEAGSEFEEMREQIRQGAPVVERRPGFTRCKSDAIVFHEYALEEGAEQDDMQAVKRCNPLSAITVESLSTKYASPTMKPPHWARFVCNVATRSTFAAIPEAMWHDGATQDVIPEDATVWLGIDFGWDWDTTAIVPFYWRDPEYRLLAPAEILEPPQAFDRSLDPAEVKVKIRELCERYRVTTVVMDPDRAHDMAAWMSDELDLLVVERLQSAKPQGEDYERFMEALRNGWLRHSGDPGLRRHALNAVAKMLDGGGARFVRPNPTRIGRNQDVRVIDALVAAAMVHSYAVEQHSAEPRTGWGVV